VTDWNNMTSQKNYTTIEMVSRIECKARLLNLIADAPKKNILNMPAWAPERLLESNKEMLLPLEHITEAAMVSKLVTCMSNQEVAKRILLDHDSWQDAKEMAIRDDDAAFVLECFIANCCYTVASIDTQCIDSNLESGRYISRVGRASRFLSLIHMHYLYINYTFHSFRDRRWGASY